MKSHIKGLLQIGDYHGKVVACDDNEGEQIRIVWRIDQGTYAYRTLIEQYDLNEYGLAKLMRMCESLNIVPFPEDHPEFYAQFLGMRAKLRVDVDLRGNVKKNVIIQHSLPELPEDYNVAKPKTDSHFYHKTNNKRRLPI